MTLQIDTDGQSFSALYTTQILSLTSSSDKFTQCFFLFKSDGRFIKAATIKHICYNYYIVIVHKM